MDEAAMRALVSRYWEEVWGRGDIALLDELYTDPYVRHNRDGNLIVPREQAKKDLVQYLRVLRDPVHTIDDQVVSGDKVWSRLTVTGVNVETERPMTTSWLQVVRIEEGRMAESWVLSAPEVDWRLPPKKR